MKVLGLMVACGLALGGVVPAVAAPAGGVPAGVQQSLYALVSEGGGVGVQAAYAGKWRGVSGSTRLGAQVPVVPTGRFRIGSITKSFVATVVLQLVAERRLELDDPVADFVPGLVPNGEDITVRQLLNHTSRIGEYTSDKVKFPMEGEEFLRKVRFRHFTDRELVETAVKQPPLTPPGMPSYSNANYILLGMVIEKVTHRSWRSEVDRRILEPLRLRETSFPTSTAIPGPHLHGYIQTDSRSVDVSRLGTSWVGAAGELISTTDDLNRFFAALLDGRLLPRSVLDQMKSESLGITAQTLSCGVTLYGHDGGIQSYVTQSVRSTDGRGLSLVVSLRDFNGMAFQKLGPLIQKTVEAAFC